LVVGATALHYASLAIVDGNPAIAFADSVDDTWYLSYTRSATATGASSADWSTPIVVDDAADSTGYRPSLAVVDGKPAVAYAGDFALYDIRFTNSSTASGTAPADWNDPQILLEECGYGRAQSMTVINGNPAISYRGYYGNLTYAYYQP
jgi:hypothetical protein